MLKSAKGFTLIELMIVVAIIAVLAAIALTAYGQYRVQAAESACLAEMKSYASFALATLHSEDEPDTAPTQACAEADDVTELGADVAGTPRSPGVRRALCDMTSGTCALEP